MSGNNRISTAHPHTCLFNAQTMATSEIYRISIGPGASVSSHGYVIGLRYMFFFDCLKSTSPPASRGSSWTSSAHGSSPGSSPRSAWQWSFTLILGESVWCAWEWSRMDQKTLPNCFSALKFHITGTPVARYDPQKLFKFGAWGSPWSGCALWTRMLVVAKDSRKYLK